MLYYRFRPLTELSLKELLYSEMYFTSPEECNDPFDSKTFYVFPPKVENWVNLIGLALSQFKQSISGEQLKSFTEYLCAKCPLTFEDAMSEDLFNDFKAISQEEVKLKQVLSNSIPQIVKLYAPATRYFVSFSKDYKEPLMWSHYANRHIGFCLIFRPINGAIKQFEFKRKHSFRRKTPNSFAKEISYEVSNEFKFIDIQYLQKVKQSNAFLHMPVAVSGDAKNEEHRERIRKEQESHYAQKSISWKYETEARLILSPPPSWLFGEHVYFTNQERLFHYDPCHLVGIIYGTRMTENQKERIREILKERDDWNLHYPNYRNADFNFMEFDAILSKNERALDIVPYAISTCQRIYAEHKNFEKLYKEWRESVGFKKLKI